MSRCVGLAAPAGSGRCPKEVSPPRQRRDGESQHGHVYLSPTYTCGHPMCFIKDYTGVPSRFFVARLGKGLGSA